MKYIFALVITLISVTAFSQQLPAYEQVTLKVGTDYGKADSIAHIAANHILSVPINDQGPDRKRSMEFIVRWMSGTPDYNFHLDKTVEQISKGNEQLLALYLCAMTKYCIHHKAQAGDQAIVKANTVKILLDYCENPSNNVKMTKYLKKLVTANKKGELEKEL